MTFPTGEAAVEADPVEQEKPGALVPGDLALTLVGSVCAGRDPDLGDDPARSLRGGEGILDGPVGVVPVAAVLGPVRRFIHAQHVGPRAAGVLLVGVGHLRAVVAAVGNAVGIAVDIGDLSGIQRAVILVVGGPVPIDVRITGVTHQVAIAIALVGVVHLRAVVAGVSGGIAIGLSLVLVGRGGAVVAQIADLVSVGIGLGGVGLLRTVVAGIAPAVRIAVLLPRVLHCGAVVAGIASAV